MDRTYALKKAESALSSAGDHMFGSEVQAINNVASAIAGLAWILLAQELAKDVTPE